MTFLKSELISEPVASLAARPNPKYMQCKLSFWLTVSCLKEKVISSAPIVSLKGFQRFQGGSAA